MNHSSPERKSLSVVDDAERMIVILEDRLKDGPFSLDYVDDVTEMVKILWRHKRRSL